MGLDEGQQLGGRLPVIELDGDDDVGDDRGHPEVVDGESGETALHALVQNLPSGVGLTHRGADDPVRQSEGKHAGILSCGLFDQREQLSVSTGEGTQHEELRGVHGERIRSANVQAELERLCGQCLGVGEPTRHHRLECLT